MTLKHNVPKLSGSVRRKISLRTCSSLIVMAGPGRNRPLSYHMHPGRVRAGRIGSRTLELSFAGRICTLCVLQWEGRGVLEFGEPHTKTQAVVPGEWGSLTDPPERGSLHHRLNAITTSVMRNGSFPYQTSQVSVCHRARLAGFRTSCRIPPCVPAELWPGGGRGRLRVASRDGVRSFALGLCGVARIAVRPHAYGVPTLASENLVVMSRIHLSESRLANQTPLYCDGAGA
jgi:hypothetical protein